MLDGADQVSRTNFLFFLSFFSFFFFFSLNPLVLCFITL